MTTKTKQTAYNKDNLTMSCICSGSVDTTKGYEEFLNNAYNAVEVLWDNYGGESIGTAEGMALRNALEIFFSDKR
jgi:hypothetical protein